MCLVWFRFFVVELSMCVPASSISLDWTPGEHALVYLLPPILSIEGARTAETNRHLGPLVQPGETTRRTLYSTPPTWAPDPDPTSRRRDRRDGELPPIWDVLQRSRHRRLGVHLES